MVCIGISVFFLARGKAQGQALSLIGVALVGDSLFFDGLVGGLQVSEIIVEKKSFF